MRNRIASLLALPVMATAIGPQSPTAAPAGQNTPSARPNIILIMTDDQGYGDLGITGNPIIETPNIDAFARQSASMTQFYVSPVCSPTRACLMTGRYNYRTRVIDTFKGRSMMEPGEITIAEVLRTAGYSTGIFGKWHLGDCYPMRPIDQGFDEALVLRGGGLAQPSEPIENARRYTDPILIHNGEEVPTKGYCTDVYFRAAMKFIDRAVSAGEPFFVYLPPNAPHGPFHDVPQALYEKYKEKDLSSVLIGGRGNADVVARVFAMVENIDHNVGRLTRKLEADGLAENTIVVFMVDNGPNTRRYVGPLRGMKTEVHDGGIRSPFYIRWPATLRPGARSDRIAAHIDVMPTLLDAAGIAVPEGLSLDGRSLLPLLQGKNPDWPDRTLFFQSHRGDVPVQNHNVAIRNQRWKLVHPTGFGNQSPKGNVAFELYDIENDRGETVNLASAHPEIVEELKRVYAARFNDVSSTRPDNYDPPRIIAGTDHETRTVLTRQDWRLPANDTAGWGSNGAWFLRFGSEKSYDVELAWPSPMGPAEIELSVGTIKRQASVEAPTRSVTLRNVRIPAGEAELSARIHQAGEFKAPYHVILVRK